MKKISEALDQYTGICKEAIMDSAAKLSKSFEKIIIEILLLYMVVPGRINFTQLGRYGKHGEHTHDAYEKLPHFGSGFNLGTKVAQIAQTSKEKHYFLCIYCGGDSWWNAHCEKFRCVKIRITYGSVKRLMKASYVICVEDYEIEDPFFKTWIKIMCI